MPLISNFLAIIGLVVAFTIGPTASGARAEQRIALVIGNADYQAGVLKTPANDAGLIAQTLEAAGFEVIGARDLDQDALRRAFRDFIDKAAALGPDDVAVVYLNGYGLQLEGENYFVPVDGRIERASDVPVQAIRVSDYARALAALKLKVSILILDLARNYPFTFKSEPIAGGLALVEPEPGTMIAFNAAPGTIAPTPEGAYGPYARALAEMMREGGLPLDGLFDRVRLRVSDATRGAQVPWHASGVAAPFVFFERTLDAPPSVATNEETSALRSRAIRDLGTQEAYIAALERDILPDYLEFLDSYPTDPLANRVRAIVAARREALIWRRTRSLDTPAAYWTYLRLYSDGPHAGDCYRRLAFLRASLEPPPEFSAIDYDTPPPPSEERVYVQQLVIFLGDPIYDFPPQPPIPESFLSPPLPEFTELLPPESPEAPFALPTPVYIPVPAWVRPPTFVQPPPANNVIFANLHNKVVIDRAGKTFTVTDHEGHTRTLQAPRGFQNREQRHLGGQAGAGRQQPASDTNVGPALPPSVAQRAARTNGTRLDRAQREQPSPVPLSGAREPRLPGALGRSNAATQPQSRSPFWADRPQRRVDDVAQQRPQPLARPGEPLPKSVPPPVVPGAAIRTTPSPTSPQGERVQSLWGGRTQSPVRGVPPATIPGPAQSSAQTGQPVLPAKPQVPPAVAAGAQGPAQGAQPLPRVVPPLGTQAAPTRQPQQLDRQREQQEQAAATARQQQRAAEVARQPAAAAAARQQQQHSAQQAAPSAAQQQAAQQAAAARAQQQAAQQAAAARAQQQAAQQAAAARAQQQAAQQAAAARAQQQAAQQAAAARAQQQAAQQAAAARAQQQAAQQAAAARAQQQAAQQAAAARAQQQAAQQATAARAQQQAAQQAAAARAQQQAAQQASAARAQQQAAQQATAARAQQQAAQQAAAARAQQQAAQQAAAAARASAAIGAARAQHVPPQRR